MASIDGQKREGRIGIIGGTGGGSLDLSDSAREPVKTHWGDAIVSDGVLQGHEVFYVLRHGKAHSVPPHKVNYRANLAALAMLGVDRVFAINACGGLADRMNPGDAVIVDQFLDFTKSRPLTFFDEEGDPVVHTDVTEPYCPTLREHLRDACAATKLTLHSAGVYVACEGPRYESAAEIRMFRNLGGDVIGMTGVPELVLAREIGICYASLSLVTNSAAGMGETQRLRHSDVQSVMEEISPTVAAVITDAVGRAAKGEACEQCVAEPE